MAKILDDEQEHLSSLRSAINAGIEQALEKNANPKEFANDVITPALDTISRRFKTITQYHKLKILGASIGTVALSLAAITNEGWIAIAAGLLGASGLGLLVNEYADYIKDRDEVKENPFYLFWNLKKARAK